MNAYWKYADPTENARFVTAEEAQEIAKIDASLLLDISTDEALIDAINAAHKAKDWEFYAELKNEFYRRLDDDKTLAPRAEDIAHKAGLITF